MRKRIDFEVSPGFCIGLAVLLLILPMRWLLAAGLAAAIHELWHCAAIYLCRGNVYRVRIRAGMTQIETSPLQPIEELFCAAAGPAGSFSLLLAARWLPLTALCGMIQGCFNLLPVLSLDGARVLRCVLQILFPQCRYRSLKYIQSIMITLLFAMLVYGAVALGLRNTVLPVTAVVLVKLCSQKKTLQRRETKGTIEIH